MHAIANLWRRHQATSIVLLSILLLGGDVVTGPRIRFPITFLIPIALAAWNFGPRIAVGLAIILTVVQFVLLQEFGTSDDSVVFGLINAIIRLVVFTGAAYTLGRLRQLQEQKASQISNLERILPICAHCRKIRDENGRWESLEEFIALDSRCSHSLCDDCAKRHYPDYFPATVD